MLSGVSGKGVSHPSALSPNMEEFSDMVRFVKSIAVIGAEFGMLKVIPPASWRAKARGYDSVDSLMRSSGRQTSEGDEGVYSLRVEDFGSIYMCDFKKYNMQAHDNETNPADFWSIVGSHDEEVYTAHSPNASLFDKEVTSWNLGKVEGNQVKNRLSRGWQVSSQGTNGVNMGIRHTARGWVREDSPAFGVAYLHFGEKRTIYSVPASHAPRVEEILNQMLPDKAQALQSQTITRTHALLLDPAVLSKRGVPVTKIVQEPGEFVVHFTDAYHCSFCHGLSCWEYVSISPSASSARPLPALPGTLMPPIAMPVPIPLLPSQQQQQLLLQQQHLEQQQQLRQTAMQHIQLQQMMFPQHQLPQPAHTTTSSPMMDLAKLAAFAESVKPELDDGKSDKGKSKTASASKKRNTRNNVEKPVVATPKRGSSKGDSNNNTTPSDDKLEDSKQGRTPRAVKSSGYRAQGEATSKAEDSVGDSGNKGQGIRRKRKRKDDSLDSSVDGKGKHGDKKDAGSADKNKNCHFCEHAPKRCSIFACTDSVCDQMFCENCCKRHLGKPTHFKGQDDADAIRWRCPICTRKCCCTLAVCNRQHLHCKRYRRKMKHVMRRGGSIGGSETYEEVPASDGEEEADNSDGSNGRNGPEPGTPNTNAQLIMNGGRLPTIATAELTQDAGGMSGLVRGMQFNFQQTAYPSLMHNDIIRGPVSSPGGFRLAHPLTPLFSVSTPTFQQGTTAVNTPAAYGGGVTPVAVGTPLTPLGDYPGVTTPFSFTAESAGGGGEDQPAHCNWFDNLFGQTALMQQQVQVLGQLQAQALSSAARQSFHPQAQQALLQSAAQQVAFISGNAARRGPVKQPTNHHGTLEDTASSWAPDEFVFSPQDEDD